MQSDQRKSSMSPYLASLSEMQVRKKVKDPTAFHAASVSSKLFGGTNCTLQEVLSYVEDEAGCSKGKGKPGKGTRAKTPLTKPPKAHVMNSIHGGDSSKSNLTRNLKSNTVHQLNPAMTSLRQAEKSLSFAEIRNNSQHLIREIGRPLRPSSSGVSIKNSNSNELKHPTGGHDNGTSIPLSKLKSILKLSSANNLAALPKSINKVKTTIMKKSGLKNNKNMGDNEKIMMRGKLDKKVSFYEKVEIHPVPYESRGSTEWQHNLMQQRGNLLKNIFAGPPLGYLSDNFLFSNTSWGGPLDNWGFGITSNRARRPSRP